MRSKMFYISKFCLLCLKEDDGSLEDVQNKDGGGVTIQEKLDYCVFELISSGHEFPGFICQECFSLLETLYVFKQKCFKSNRKIRNFMDSLKQMQFSALSYRDLSVPIQKLENIIPSVVNRKSIIKSPKKEVDKKLKKNLELQFPKINFFECEMCTKQFTSTFLLQRHLKTHSNIKPYECTECFTKFTRKDNLKCHEQQHCKNKISKIAKKLFQDKKINNKINKKVKMDINRQSFQCGLCSTTISHKANLKRHFLRFHVQSKQDFNLSYNVIDTSNRTLDLQNMTDLTNGEGSDTDTASTLTSPEIDLESLDDDVILLEEVEQEETLLNTSRNNKTVARRSQNNKSSNLTEKNLKETEDGSLMCFVCQKTFTRKCKLSAHVGSHFQDMPYKN